MALGLHRPLLQAEPSLHTALDRYGLQKDAKNRRIWRTYMDLPTWIRHCGDPSVIDVPDSFARLAHRENGPTIGDLRIDPRGPRIRLIDPGICSLIARQGLSSESVLSGSLGHDTTGLRF